MNKFQKLSRDEMRQVKGASGGGGVRCAVATLCTMFQFGQTYSGSCTGGGDGTQCYCANSAGIQQFSASCIAS